MTTKTKHHRNPLLLVAAGFTVLLAAGCSSGAAPADYFAGFDQAQTDLDTTAGELFHSPLAQQVDAFVDDDDPPDSLDPDQDALAQEFVTEFWTGMFDAVAIHRDDITDLDVPDSIKTEHDAYIDALDAMLDSKDDRMAEVASSSGTELLQTFWDPGAEVEAVDDTCRAIVDEATDAGFTITSPICEQ